jgi:hypothetical protein
LRFISSSPLSFTVSKIGDMAYAMSEGDLINEQVFQYINGVKGDKLILAITFFFEKRVLSSQYI